MSSTFDVMTVRGETREQLPLSREEHKNNHVENGPVYDGGGQHEDNNIINMVPDFKFGGNIRVIGLPGKSLIWKLYTFEIVSRLCTCLGSENERDCSAVLF